MTKLCGKHLKTRTNTKYDPPGMHRCSRLAMHAGRCHEYPYLDHLAGIAKKVRAKIIRDATKTTGASWKSKDAGPNRISRWAMLLSDSKLKKLGINMKAFKPLIVAKLRDKSASYDDCMDSARKLTWLVYGMQNAPVPDTFTKKYLEDLFGEIVCGTTACLICRAPLDFNLFQEARRGKAEIETAHAEPRSHNSLNIGFAHRHCNIAQGDKSLKEFYMWIKEILIRAKEIGNNS